MPKFIVHLYPLVRIKLKREFEAATYEEAVEQAQKYAGNMHYIFDDENNLMLIEDGEEQHYALVDVVGDEEFEHSRWVHLSVGNSFGPQLWVQFQALLEWAIDNWYHNEQLGGVPQVICDAKDLNQQIEDELKLQKSPPPEEFK